LNGAALDLGGRRQRAVLALLVLARGDIVPADRLVDSIWSGNPPANAAGALQAYVSRLRSRLEPGGTARARANLIMSRASGDALAALRRARDTLADQLGVDPGPALRTLEAEVLAQSPGLDPAPASPAMTGAAEPATVGPAEPAMAGPGAAVEPGAGRRADED